MSEGMTRATDGEEEEAATKKASNGELSRRANATTGSYDSSVLASGGAGGGGAGTRPHQQEEDLSAPKTPEANDKKTGHRRRRPRSGLEILVKIVSARYGPCEKRIAAVGAGAGQDEDVCRTRDVAPFLRALLVARQAQEAVVGDGEGTATTAGSRARDDPNTVRLSAIVGNRSGGMKRTQIRVLDGLEVNSMNAVFGDPCPGTSKRLHVDYVVSEVPAVLDDNDGGRREDERRYNTTGSKAARAASAKVHHMSFAEHEKVVLPTRKLRLFQQEDFKEATERVIAGRHFADDDSTSNLLLTMNCAQHEKGRTSANNDHEMLAEQQSIALSDASTLSKARQLGRTQSMVEFAQCFSQSSTDVDSPSKTWRLRSATSEIALPMVMDFLEVKERVKCRLVCCAWKNIVRHWGVATTIDSSDASFPSFTRPFFRGIIRHSYSSLRSLNLCGFEDLQKSDLHPSIPYLRKIRSLDVSHCIHLDDSTLHLLSEHAKETLEVLYMKGLRNVSDAGVISVCRSCLGLRVLDVSNIPISDEAGVEIGQNLGELRALYMRDNFLLTDRSIDVITGRCSQLEQLTLWGCIKMKHAKFNHSGASSGKLVMLNLWGCHALKDDTAGALEGMHSLRSLIVSECHRLTDNFLVSMRRSFIMIVALTAC